MTPKVGSVRSKAMFINSNINFGHTHTVHITSGQAVPLPFKVRGRLSGPLEAKQAKTNLC